MERVRFAVTPGAPMELDDEFFNEARAQWDARRKMAALGLESPAEEVASESAAIPEPDAADEEGDELTVPTAAAKAAYQEWEAWREHYESALPVFEERWTANEVRGWAEHEARLELNAFLAGEPFELSRIHEIDPLTLTLWSRITRHRGGEKPDIFALLYPAII